MNGDSIEFHTFEDSEWTAVYLNGKLVRVGDNYLADEWLQQHVGVKVVMDNAFMRGGDNRDTVAKTLDEVHDYMLARDRMLQQAAELRRQAAVLEADAQLLEAGL